MLGEELANWTQDSEDHHEKEEHWGEEDYDYLDPWNMLSYECQMNFELTWDKLYDERYTFSDVNATGAIWKSVSRYCQEEYARVYRDAGMLDYEMYDKIIEYNSGESVIVGLNFNSTEFDDKDVIGFCMSPDQMSYSCAASVYDEEFGFFGPVKTYFTTGMEGFDPWNQEPVEEWTAAIEGWTGEVEYDWELYEYSLNAGKSLSDKFVGTSYVHFYTFAGSEYDLNMAESEVVLNEFYFSGAFQSLAVSLVASFGMIALTM